MLSTYRWHRNGRKLSFSRPKTRAELPLGVHTWDQGAVTSTKLGHEKRMVLVGADFPDNFDHQTWVIFRDFPDRLSFESIKLWPLKHTWDDFCLLFRRWTLDVPEHQVLLGPVLSQWSWNQNNMESHFAPKPFFCVLYFPQVGERLTIFLFCTLPNCFLGKKSLNFGPGSGSSSTAEPIFREAIRVKSLVGTLAVAPRTQKWHGLNMPGFV